MNFSLYLGARSAGRTRSQSPSTRRPALKTRLEVEALEGRLVPATLVVNTPNDSVSALDGLTLREAILLVNNGGDALGALGRSLASNEASQISGSFGGDTIQFSASALSGQTITLTSDLPTISQDVAIVGLGARVLAVSGNSQFQIFYVDDADVLISDLTIRNGLANQGAGIRSNQYLILARATVTGNRTQSGNGAGIYNSGSMYIIDSTIAGNTSSNLGGGIYNIGPLGMVNSTVSGNSAAIGGGIYNAGEASSVGAAGGVLDVVNCTITGNIGTPGGGIYTQNASATEIITNGGSTSGDTVVIITYFQGTTYLNNTIVAGNNIDLTGPVDAGFSHNNLIGNASFAGGLTHGQNGNIVGNQGGGSLPIAAILNPTLANNGGPTDTHALVQNSLAIDNGANDEALDITRDDLAPLTTDQRGFSRIVNDTVDIGAVEFENLPPVLIAPANQQAVEGTQKSFSLGSFTDVPTNGGPWLVEVDWGDGQTSTFTTSSQGSLGTRTHTYADNTSPAATGYQVTVKVTDAGGLADTETFKIFVDNAQPVVAAAADQTAVEAVAKSFDLGSFADLGLSDGPWNVTVNWGDGSSTVSFQTNSQGSLGTLAHTFQDNSSPASLGFTVTVKVTDKDGGSNSSDYQVVVSNQNPTPTVSLRRLPPFQNDSGPPVISAGASQRFVLEATDPSPADAAAGFTFLVDWGDGTTPLNVPASANNGSGVTISHPYAAEGLYKISVTVQDKDLGQGQVGVDLLARKPLALFNGSFLDYTGAADSEASNILNSLGTLGYQSLFDTVGDDDSGTRVSFVGKKLLLVPELENSERGDFLATLNSGARSNLRNFIGAGGAMIVFGQGNLNPTNTANFLNQTFDFNVRESFVGQYDDGVHRFNLSAPAAANTAFAEGPATININDSTSQLTNLPENARRIYALAGSGNAATVAILPYIEGQIIYLGWDWYNADASYQDQQWFDVLASALQTVNEAADDLSISPQFAALVAEASLLADLREQYGFQATARHPLNKNLAQLEWIRDRAGKLYALTPAGDIVAWTGKWASARKNVIAHVGEDVYNDSTLLFNAPVALTEEETQQLVQLQETYHFHGTTLPQRKPGQKWLQDDQNQWYVLSADGTLRKWTGKNLASSPVIATVNPLVFDDLNLLFEAIA